METTPETRPTTTVDLPRFGECTFLESDVMEFPWGIPGFSGHRRWLVLTLDTQPGFVWLQSLDDLGVAVPTANPWTLFETYDPKIPAYAFAALGIKEASDFATLCVVVVGARGESMTINLAAPIILNLRTRKAVQVLCDNAGYSSNEPVPRKAGAEAALSAKAS